MSDSLVKSMADLGKSDSRRFSNDSVFFESVRRRFSHRQSSPGDPFVFTGIVYDERMLAHKNEVSDHPECPKRISYIWKELVKEGVVECCKRVEAREATEEEILLVHTKTHYDGMLATKDMSLEKLFHYSLQYSSIYMNNSSISCALLSAGSVCEITKKVLFGDLDNGLAVVRPPGHHAEPYKPMGFCFFNNVAVAAKMAIEKFGVRRVLIVDWDVHHGNATQNMFYNENRVLYVSLHRYDNGMFFPATDEGNYDKIGSEEGCGYNINIPWNNTKMGDPEYLAAFHQIILPVAYEYNPELVIISCGFDSGEGDPLGGYGVTPSCYGHMTHMLKGIANGKVVVVLEGGYNLTTISNSACCVAEVLLGDTPQALDRTCVANTSAMNTIRDVCIQLSSHWGSLSHWSSQKTGVTMLPPVAGEQAELTEDSMNNWDSNAPPDTPISSDNITNDITVKQKNQPDDDSGTKIDEFGRTMGSHDPPPNPETPPEGSVPISSGKLPLSQAQQSMIESLESEGNVCMFAVSPKAWCQHLESIVSFSDDDTVNTKALCEVCQTPRENWVCLTCHRVLCGRYINQHMVQHNEEAGHSIALSFTDLSVWCFPCDSYVHNPILFPFIEKARINKFGST